MTRERLERATGEDSVARARRDENEPLLRYLHPFPPGGLALALALTLTLALSLPLPLVGVVAVSTQAAGGAGVAWHQLDVPGVGVFGPEKMATGHITIWP